MIDSDTIAGLDRGVAIRACELAAIDHARTPSTRK
jgi:hypothetical protein